PGAGTDRGQTRPGPGEGVPESRGPLRGWHAEGFQCRYSARVDSFTAAQQCGPVGPQCRVEERVRAGGLCPSPEVGARPVSVTDCDPWRVLRDVRHGRGRWL